MQDNTVKLDKRDLKILQILDFKARENYSNIGKKLKISKQAVEYRINNLIKKKIITGFYTVIDIGQLGFIPYRIAIKLHNINQEKEQEILDFFKTQKNVGWVFSLGGKWDIALTIYSKNIIEFEEQSKKILYKLNPYILEKSISLVSSIHNYPYKFLFSSTENKDMIVGKEISSQKIDKLGISILKELSQDARISLIKLSEKVKQNPKTIAYRIKGLEKNKIILGYRTSINTSLLGYEHYKVFLFLKNINQEIENQIVSYIKEQKNSIYFTSAIGIADMEFEIKVKNPEEMYEIINKLRQNFKESIVNYETLLIRKEHLINYLPELN